VHDVVHTSNSGSTDCIVHCVLESNRHKSVCTLMWFVTAAGSLFIGDNSNHFSCASVQLNVCVGSTIAQLHTNAALTTSFCRISLRFLAEIQTLGWLFAACLLVSMMLSSLRQPQESHTLVPQQQHSQPALVRGADL